MHPDDGLTRSYLQYSSLGGDLRCQILSVPRTIPVCPGPHVAPIKQLMHIYQLLRARVTCTRRPNRGVEVVKGANNKVMQFPAIFQRKAWLEYPLSLLMQVAYSSNLPCGAWDLMSRVGFTSSWKYGIGVASQTCKPNSPCRVANKQLI